MLALPWLACGGCYYGHLAAGQTRLLLARQPIEELAADTATDAELRLRFELAERVRGFAASLGLDVGDQYTSYVAWPGDRIVTTIVATRPGEVEAAGFWFPIVGRVPYKGFFAQERAEGEAAALRADGLDVCVVPVTAYSTLGWLDDPLTGPMLRAEPIELVETLLHELVHATVFIPSEPDFNEGVASFVGEEAALRFLRSEGLPGDARSPAALADEQLERISDSRMLAHEMLVLRQQIDALYAQDLAVEIRDERRSRLAEAARARIAQLAFARLDGVDLAARVELGDACLALRGTYARDTPRHRALLGELGGDLAAFVERFGTARDADRPRESFFAPVAR